MAFNSANVADSDQGLFSREEMLSLMRGEFFRAKRYDYSLVCMLISVDRLGSLQDLYGVESKQEILRGTVDLLSSVTRASDYLGCLVDDRLLAIFPHTNRAGAGALAWRLLKGAREMQFDSDGRLIQVTLSIGAADTAHASIDAFDRLVKTAEAGLAIAIESGGDRYVVREEMESELERLQSKLDELKAAGPAPAVGPAAPAAAAPAQPAQPAPAAPAAPEPAELERDEAAAARADLGSFDLEFVDDGTLDGRIRAAFSALIGESVPGLTDLVEHVIAMTQQEVHAERERATESSSTEYQQRISMLERRVNKLNGLLGMTEEELKRVLKMKNVDPGLSSIYRAVQGLGEDESQAELKKVLMEKIFQANLSLQKEKSSS